MDKIQMENQANNKSIPIQDNINPSFNMSKTMNIINIFEHDIHSVNKNQKNMTEIDNQFNNNMMNLNQMNNQFNNNSMMNMNQGDDEFNNMMNMNQDNNQFNNNMMNMNQNESQFNNNMMNMNQDNSQFNNNMNNMNQDNSQFNNNMMNMNQDNNQFNNNNMINMNQDNQFNNNSMMIMNNQFNNNGMMNMNQINDQYNNNNQNNERRNSMGLKYPENFGEFNFDNIKSGLSRQRTQSNIFENKITLFDEEIDAYPYIKEEKKLIIFERNDKKQVRVKVPASLRNNELYSTAKKYKINEYSDMDLFYNNNILKIDDSPIDKISDGGKVVIVEILDELNNSIYEKEYLPTLKANNVINIIFKFSSGKKKSMVFSKKTKIKEMLKIFFQESKILEKAKKHYRITYDSKELNLNDDSLIGDIIIYDGAIVNVDQIEEKYVQGKQLKVSLKNKNNPLLDVKTGTLETIKSFYYNLETNILSNKKIKKVIIKGKAINKDDESTFASYDIRNDFTCNILFMGDQERKEDYQYKEEKEEKGILSKLPCLII